MSFNRIIDFIKFRFKSGNQHSLHSPFVFKLYTEVIKKNEKNELFIPIEEHRTELTLDRTIIEVSDFGANTNKSNKRRVSSIAKSSLKPPRQSRLLYRLVKHFNPTSIIELGTSLGTTTSYIATASKNRITTFEGSQSIANIAQEFFDQQQYDNINVITGNIDSELPKFIDTEANVDFVFFDANHRYEPTMNYFNLCLSKCHDGSVFIFDDIYWSAEMKKAWNEILKNDQVTVSIDLFHIGLIFFRKKQPKQHFRLRF